ncbi:hypothetical protein [Longispora albida]|uniref:hypothetical protein n=1 Tax=Longispora albida TaxID=203523 RepID=UPI00035D0A19|nr:hypothetical protein [Longispora albida]
MRPIAVSTLAVTVLLAAATPAVATAPTAPREPSLTGSVRLKTTTEAELDFTIDARGVDQAARGTFRIRHKEGGEEASFTGEVDCLQVGGQVAVMTGRVTWASDPRMPLGVRIGLTVHDQGRHDRLGASWQLAHMGDLPPCTGMAPMSETASGNFTVRG